MMANAAASGSGPHRGSSSEAAADPRALTAGFRSHWLDALNFLLADVRGGLGPYLNVFLVTQQHWSQSEVGLMTTISGFVGLAAQTPVGAAIDATNAKRAVIVVSLGGLALGAIVIFALPTFWPALIANSTLAVVGDVFGPAVAALTLGLYVQNQLSNRMGRNAAFDHAGNVAIAAVAAAVGWKFGQRAVFLLVPIFAALACIATLAIPGAAIDHQRARGSSEDDGPSRESWTQIFSNKPLVAFGASLMLFHFANAPLLPLVGQKLAQSHPSWATALMSSCIVAAQLVMLPIALVVGKKAEDWGRKPILLAGFVILPIRALLYTLSDDAPWLVGVQLLDGVGAGILSVLTPLVVADLTRGAGRYNFALGAVTTAQGIGASLSGLGAGVIVDEMGYSAAFVECGIAAAAALAVLAVFVPESRGAPAAPQKDIDSSAAGEKSASLFRRAR
jgi:MFS family permease